MTYTFKITPELVELARHAIENHKWQKDPYTGEEAGCGLPLAQPEKPALMIVKDQGCYLMSPFTIEGAPESARCRNGPVDRLQIVYAEGRDPNKDEDWWEGGDDYGENLPGLPEMIVISRSCYGTPTVETVQSSYARPWVEVEVTAKTVKYTIIHG